MNRKEVEAFLKKHDLSDNELATKAGVGRWSLHRWLTRPNTTITLTTADKLQVAMWQIEKE